MAYVHPLIELTQNNSSEQDILDNLDLFCGKKLIDYDLAGQPIYEVVDQTLFIAQVTLIMDHAVQENHVNVFGWIIREFVPLDVSSSHNDLFFKAGQLGRKEMTDLLVNHESFHPTHRILQALISKSDFDGLKACLSKSRLNAKYSNPEFANLVNQRNQQGTLDYLHRIKFGI